MDEEIIDFDYDYELEIIIEKLKFLLHFEKKDLIKIDWTIYEFLWVNVNIDSEDKDTISVHLYNPINGEMSENIFGLWRILRTNFDEVNIDKEIENLNIIKQWDYERKR